MITPRIEVFIDPDGTLRNEIGLIVLVRHASGVIYSTQCNGLNTERRSAEGFLIPVGGHRLADSVMDWFQRQRPCVETWKPADWTNDRIASLADLVSRIPIWHCEDGEDKRGFMHLDVTRIAECVEAWIPVTTPHGEGYLLSPNSD